MVLEDGTTRTRTAKVLAASTAAVAADPAIVVAVSPNNTPVLTNGAATETTFATLTSQSTFSTLSGGVTEAAPANDTASSGLNSRLQRIAQRITSLIALVPASLGAKTSANSFAVVLASDQATVPVSLASVPSHAVTNAGTFAVQDSEKVADNAAFTDGTTKVMPVGFIFDETAGTALTENDAGAGRIDAKRAQVMVIEDGTIRGSTQRATVKAASTAAVAGDPALVVAVSPNNTVPTTSVGTVAHDAADSGAPVKVGAKAKSTLAGLTLVAADDRTDAYGDVDGVIITKPYATNADIIAGVGTASNTAADTAVTGMTGGAASVFGYITSLQITNTGALSPTVTLKNGSAGATLAVLAAPPGGGCNVVFPVPLKITTANTTLHFACSVASGASSAVTVSAQGFKSKA